MSVCICVVGYVSIFGSDAADHRTQFGYYIKKEILQTRLKMLYHMQSDANFRFAEPTQNIRVKLTEKDK